MLRISKLADYATAIMHYIFEHPELAITAVQIATGTGIALPTVRKVLKLLVAAKLLNSTRGAHGGYELVDKGEDISLAHIIEAIDGPIAMVECALPGNHCNRKKDCNTKDHWHVVNHIVKGALSAVPLKHVMNTDHVRSVMSKIGKELL